jgi:hypothetical protein
MMRNLWIDAERRDRESRHGPPPYNMIISSSNCSLPRVCSCQTSFRYFFGNEMTIWYWRSVGYSFFQDYSKLPIWLKLIQVVQIMILITCVTWSKKTLSSASRETIECPYRSYQPDDHYIWMDISIFQKKVNTLSNHFWLVFQLLNVISL